MKNMKSKRRKFLKNSAKAAGASLILPQLISCENKPIEHMPTPKTYENSHIVGHGDFKYKVHKNWGDQDPAKVPVRDCHEMVQDSKGRLFMLTNHPKNNMMIYDRSGKILDTWTLGLAGAHGLTLSDQGGEEFLYLTSSDEHKVFKTDLKGNVLLELGHPKEVADYEEAEQFLPTETAVAPNGNFYVADGYGQNFIIQYNSKGEYIRHWGGKGDEAEQFDCCHGVTLDNRDANNPSLLITSRSKQEFKRFTLDGKLLETIALPGCWICRPVIKGDNLYFAVIVTKSWWAYDGCIAVLDKNNKVLSFPGATAPTYSDEVLAAPDHDDFTFLNPHDVCIDNDENIYVPQWMSGKTYPVKLERV